GREAFEFVDGVRLHAIGGEQVLLCRVHYEPGKQVPWHAHEDTERVMFIVEGEVEMTIEDETATLKPGDVAVVNRGLHHTLHSEGARPGSRRRRLPEKLGRGRRAAGLGKDREGVGPARALGDPHAFYLQPRLPLSPDGDERLLVSLGEPDEPPIACPLHARELE